MAALNSHKATIRERYLNLQLPYHKTCLQPRLTQVTQVTLKQGEMLQCHIQLISRQHLYLSETV